MTPSPSLNLRVHLIIYLNWRFLNFFLTLFKVAGQDYESHVSPEYIIKGNDVLMKCGIPSFVADFVQVIGWLEESTNQELFPSDKSMGTFLSH